VSRLGDDSDGRARSVPERRSMTSHDGEITEPRTISKAVFEVLVFAMMLVLVVVEVIATSAVCLALGLRAGSGLVGGLGVLNLVLARVFVDGILKRLGLSRSGKTLEVRGRTVATAEGEVDDDETVEVRCPSSYVRGLGLMCLGICLVVALILAVVPHEKMTGVGSAYALLALFGLGAGYCLYEARWGRPQAWADATGITGYPVGFHSRRRLIPWSDVATCEIETYHDTFGKPVIVRPILKDWNGQALLTLNLLYTKMEDQERLVKFIKAKLPKPKLDYWE
jgi:hypothetical protein